MGAGCSWAGSRHTAISTVIPSCRGAAWAGTVPPPPTPSDGLGGKGGVGDDPGNHSLTTDSLTTFCGSHKNF